MTDQNKLNLPITVALDIRPLSGRFTGDRTYWMNLVEALAALDDDTRFLLLTRLGPEEGVLGQLPDRFRLRVIHSKSDRFWSLVLFPAACRRYGADVAHVQYTVPPLPGCPVVTTIHDISFRLFPELFATKDRFLLNTSLPGSLRRASRIIAVSENTRNDILREFAWVPREKVVATPLAATGAYRLIEPTKKSLARDLLLERYGVKAPYVLSVGVLQPRKNLPLLIRAFSSARQETGARHTLVVAGKRGWLSAETEFCYFERR